MMTREYSLLFNTLTDSIAELEQILDRLQKAQLEAEKMLLFCAQTQPQDKQILFPAGKIEKEH